MNCLLIRDKMAEEGELEAAEKVWGSDLFRFRSHVPSGSTVVGRYSVLPHYDELEEELRSRDSHLVHSHSAHRRIADMSWYHALEGMTPETWDDKGWETVPDCEHGWVVKGRTNSRKWKWSEMMRAETRDDLKRVMRRVGRDTMLSDQGTVIREYVPLERVGEGINGLPFANEWRLFFLGERYVAGGFYWTVAECADSMGDVPEAAVATGEEAARRFSVGHEFFVVDVAKTKEGDWIVVEINDGQMSGLSTIDPIEFYSSLKEACDALRN